MAVYETFSKRMKRLSQQGQTDVYQYKELPQAFRVQVVHIWKDAIPLDTPYGSSYWQGIHDVMARELGVFRLPTLQPPPSTRNPSNHDYCVNFLLSSTPDNALDIIELSFQVIDTLIRTEAEYDYSSHADSAISELNHRFPRTQYRLPV
jgi:AbiJ-like protein